MMKGSELPYIVDAKIVFTRQRSCSSYFQPCHATLNSRLQSLEYITMMKPWDFGIPGFEYCNVLDEPYRHEGEEYGYRLTQLQEIQTLYNSINEGTGSKCGLVAPILDQLQKIADCFQPELKQQSVQDVYLRFHHRINL